MEILGKEQVVGLLKDLSANLFVIEIQLHCEERVELEDIQQFL